MCGRFPASICWIVGDDGASPVSPKKRRGEGFSCIPPRFFIILQAKAQPERLGCAPLDGVGEGCEWRGSNPHAQRAQDFKSRLSASSNTLATDLLYHLPQISQAKNARRGCLRAFRASAMPLLCHGKPVNSLSMGTSISCKKAFLAPMGRRERSFYGQK